MNIFDIVVGIFVKYGLVMSFITVGAIMAVSIKLSEMTNKRIAGSAIAITIGLVLAYFGGTYAGGSHGLADIAFFSGIGVMGGKMLLNYGIVATAMGVRFKEIRKVGFAGVLSLFVGVFAAYTVGAIVAYALGYHDPVEVCTIASGTTGFLIGPVVGEALGGSSAAVTIGVASGVLKAVIVMIVTPYIAKRIGLDNPQTAMVFGGILGTTSGTVAGLAATDVKLVPYGAMTATFFSGLGVLLCPSVMFLLTKMILG